MFNTKLLLVFTLLILILKQTLSFKNDICDRESNLENFADRIALNAKIDTNEEHVKFLVSNSTNIEECVQQCCGSMDCHLVFFKDLKTCFLVTCKSDTYCAPIPNEKKSNTDPIDYMIKIRSAEKEELPSLPEEKQILSQQEIVQCTMNSSNTDCLLNEVCLMGKCVCPKELSYRRIDGQCREYLKKSFGCSMFIGECNFDLNEECVTLNNIARHGTCQCKIGFKRNLKTSMCEKFTLKFDDQQKASNKRKRPDLNDEANTDDEYALDNILKELGVEKSDILSDQLKTTTAIVPNIGQNLTTKTTEPSISIAHKIKTTTTTTTTTEEPVTEPPKIDTADLKAFAGNDIHVYYPTTTVILDGSLTRYYGSGGNDGITGWLWIKHDSSPAFGKFYQSNDKPLVIYEQMVEGTYKFILKVWTKSSEFSQDTLNVYVHSYMNSSELLYMNKNNKSMLENEFINENIIQIEIDTDPRQFSEAFKANFINKLNILLQQSKLKNPRVILVKTDVSLKLKKSRVILDMLVCENAEEEQKINKTNLSEDIFSFEYLVKISQDNHLSRDSSQYAGTRMRRVLEKTELISLLKRNHKIYTFKNSFGSYLNTNNDLVTDYLGLKITEIGQLACDLNNKSSNFNCSNHGYCDSITHKCVCNKYWMPNLFRFYFQNENDLTNGNNCEWNFPAFITLTSILSVFLVIISGKILKKVIYYFYYIFCCICCCCCRRKKGVNSNKYDDFKKKKYSKFDLYLEEKLNRDQFSDSDEDNDSEKIQKLPKYKKSALNKLKSKFRSVPSLGNKNLHKYALLNEEDETKVNKSNSKKDRMGAKLELGQTISQEEEDEDVVFDQNISISPEATKKSNKKSNEYIKEYKEIV